MAALREGAAARAFNTCLMGTCLMEPAPLALGCLGIIELEFAGISARIGDTVVQRGWIPETALVHYSLHAAIDERHAADFFDVVAEDWRRSSEKRREIQDGVRLGRHVFARLYEDLLREAEREAS